MKKINLSHSEQRLLLLLLSLLCIAVSYFLIFQNTTKKAAEIETQNEERRAQVAQLEQMVGQQGIVETCQSIDGSPKASDVGSEGNQYTDRQGGIGSKNPTDA